MAAGSLDGAVYIYQIEPPTPGVPNGPTEERIPTGHVSVLSVAFLGENILATAGIDPSKKGIKSPVVKLWNLDNTKKPIRELKGHPDDIYSLASLEYTATKYLLASGSNDKTIIVCEINPEDLQPDTAANAATSSNQTGTLNNVPLLKVTLKGHTDLVRSLAFDCTGTWLASGGGVTDHNILLWSMQKIFEELKLNKKPADHKP